MTTDESIMEEMLDRATNPAKERVDELGVQMFCIVVRSHVHLVHKAQEMIVAKVRSANVTEATRAISLLEECMTQCGEEFQDEAGKFRFLNELIRLVSKKYKGSETPHEVKQRIMECLLLWTTEFPQRQKIRDAYDMLRNEGDIEHGQTEAAVAKRESVLGTIDEAMFAKLIKSNNQENFKRANLLLQYRMAQEARRNELLSQHRLELNEVLKTMELLNQMLDTYDPSNKDVSETITDLYIMCKKHKPIFQHMTQLLDDNDAQLLADTLDANGALLTTMQRYNQLVPSPTKNTAPASAPATADPLADLSDIFSSALAESESKQSTEKAGSGLLKPEVLSQCTASDGLGNGSSCSSSSDSSRKPGTERKMPQIDVLSEELFQKILPSQERMSSFKRDPEKVTLNDMAKERMQIKAPEVAQTQTQTQPLAVAAAAAAELVDDVPLLSDAPLTVEQEPQQETAPQQTHLSDISIELDNVQATGEQRVVLDDDDMQLSLNFTSDRPGHRVSVIVISAQNKSRQPVRDFHFEASVKKPCKVRLLPPTESAMPPHKPFRPATPINQVMLLLNPTGKAVDVTCIVGYKLGDDPDPIKESIVAQNIAYVD
ncbi:ADP-ribosylation factor-binding protein GGA3 isoform X2 [Drosophila guanche]|uniref:ADP-ribosylation factor-binding protein GGA3 isoform X2 n=1 Tax=Drosophila guanche TaxID=7266 RepID=UPI0014714A0B|nr:ADP-ribosylation factor-binding protein GGA3 isoform X2 [Drosophila guanche]